MANSIIQDTDAPDHGAAIAQYQRRAGLYDLELAAFEPVRRRAIAHLGLAPGATVLDLGCGTGLSFEQLQRAVGPAGRVVGVEQCEAMLSIARDRIARHGWANVSVVSAAVEAADLTTAGLADAAIFHFTHDVLRSDAALANVGRYLRPGAVVVAAGLQWAPVWCWPVNVLVLSAALHSVSSLEGLAEPWSRLATLTDGLEVEPILAGGGFLARGVRTARSIG